MSPKTILITGSGSGIGKATALALAARGHRVIATTRHESDATALKKIAHQRNLTLESFALDITNSTDRQKIQQFDLDVLINNAAIGETGSLAEINIDKVRENFETNVFATLEITQSALKNMLAKNSGTIIFISSIAGRITIPFFGPYSMTKFALSSGAEMLRDELSQITNSVHVAIVEPGTYHTGFNQKMIAKKFAWMDKNSYFAAIRDQLENKERRQFELLEQKDLSSIVHKIIQASEAKNPRLRYVAPWWQGLGVQILRMFGK